VIKEHGVEEMNRYIQQATLICYTMEAKNIIPRLHFVQNNYVIVFFLIITKQQTHTSILETRTMWLDKKIWIYGMCFNN
jgi:hypothetical protein